MYIPPYFALTDPASIRRFIRENSFGMLITCGSSRPEITHVPFLLEDPIPEHSESESPEPHTGLDLLFHVAAANPHPEMGAATAVFTGPHAYISPAWYEEPNSVPTWNYIAIHIHGHLQKLESEKEIRWLMQRSVQEYELPREIPWTLEWNNYQSRLVSGVRCFRLRAQEVQAKAKLGQNHSVQRRKKVIEHLNRGNEQDRQVASLMQEFLMNQAGTEG